MKPFHLATGAIKNIPKPELVDSIRRARANDPGEIDNNPISAIGWDADPFLDHLRNCGWRFRECKKYTSLSLTFVNGSCRWHDDPGFGVVACWLVYSENPFSDDAQLVTRHGPLDMREGDLCVFDADQGHAWLSNAVCVMVMVTIAPFRGGKP
jgi:hypothetical protein